MSHGYAPTITHREGESGNFWYIFMFRWKLWYIKWKTKEDLLTSMLWVFLGVFESLLSSSVLNSSKYLTFSIDITWMLAMYMLGIHKGGGGAWYSEIPWTANFYEHVCKCTRPPFSPLDRECGTETTCRYPLILMSCDFTAILLVLHKILQRTRRRDKSHQTVFPHAWYWSFQIACPRSRFKLGACALMREYTMCVFGVYTA